MTSGGLHHRTCCLCEAMCGIVVEHRDGEVVSIKPNRDDVLSRGHICPKAVALKDLHEDPDRLRAPLRRTRSGWEETSWAAAFDGFRYRGHTAADAASGARAVVETMATALQLPRHDVHVAGPAAFVDAAGAALVAAGVPPAQIRTTVA